jgi:hypothetical protein
MENGEKIMSKATNKIFEKQVELTTELMGLLSDSFITCTSADKYCVEIQTKKLVDAQEVHRLIIELAETGKTLQKLDECKDRFCRLRESYKSMVGALYLSIAWSKLIKMQEEYVKLGGDKNDLPAFSRPCADGRPPM